MIRSALLGLVLVALLAGASFGAPESPPANAGSAGNVTVYRDAFGVPHIYGDTAEAASYAFGYAQAQDHLEQMRRNYLTAAGRLAEFGLGSAANDNDVHLLHVPQTAQASYQALVPEHRSRIDAFVAGINRYIFEEAGNLPEWVVYVQPYEVLAWRHYFAMAEQHSIANREMNAGVADSAALSGDGASNMWAVSPSMSTLGVAMLNGDPHLPWTEPLWQWYEAHLSYPGANVAGAGLFGAPAIVTGANDNVAWTMTDNFADNADIYAETVNPNNDLQYLRDGQWVDVQAETVTIKEKVGEDIVEQTFTNYYSVHGPLIGSGSGVYYSAAMSSFDNVIGRFFLFDVNEATSIATLRDPAQVPDLDKWNIIAADRAGNISYTWNARVAHKPESINWSQPVDGSISANDWGSLLTIGELPQTVNPSWGYVQNANNSAWTSAPDLNPADFPNYIGNGGFNDRPRRAVEILESRPQHSIQDMVAMAFDSLSVRARTLLPVALDLWVEVGPGTPDPNGDLQAGMDLLAAWDFVQDRESPETALGYGLIDAFYDSNPSFKPNNVPQFAQWIQADKDKLVAALQTSTGLVLTNFGQLNPLWGDVHKIQRGSQTFRVGGGSHELPALHMANVDQFANGVAWAESGSSYVFNVAFTDPISFSSIRPLGESEDPTSPHFADQTQLFVDGQLKQVWMTLAGVQANAESSFSLTYDGPSHNTDGDGCTDGQELGVDETLGGRRDPTNPHDFYDVLGFNGGPLDGIIDLPNDILGVIQHFSPTGAPPYDVQLDRGPSLGPNAWNMTAPDGVIDLPNDVLGVILQFNHNCQ